MMRAFLTCVALFFCLVSADELPNPCENYDCENGGTCWFNGFAILCNCHANYTGKRCQVTKEESTPKGRLPECPNTGQPTICDMHQCVVDQDCPGSSKCCVGGCGSQLCRDTSTQPCNWDAWAEWNSCFPMAPDSYCGANAGRQRRNRKLIIDGTPVEVRPVDLQAKKCLTMEGFEEIRPCSLPPCRPCPLGTWERWSECSVTCGSGGTRSRVRRTQDFPGGCSSYERREESQIEPCSGPSCPGICIDVAGQCANQGSPACNTPASYEGSKNTTVGGRSCQFWNVRSPHKHSFTQLGAHNHCRNPNGNTAPWCYTADSNYRWEYCFPDCDPTPCRDKQRFVRCRRYVSQGMCNPAHKHFFTAFENCCLSCKQAKDPNVGRNADSRCEEWAREGRCDETNVAQKCKYSCQKY